MKEKTLVLCWILGFSLVLFPQFFFGGLLFHGKSCQCEKPQVYIVFTGRGDLEGFHNPILRVPRHGMILQVRLFHSTYKVVPGSDRYKWGMNNPYKWLEKNRGFCSHSVSPCPPAFATVPSSWSWPGSFFHLYAGQPS